MAFNGKKALIFIFNRLWFGLALFLVTVAVAVSMGRWAIGELDEYRPLVNQFISETLGSRLMHEFRESLPHRFGRVAARRRDRGTDNHDNAEPWSAVKDRLHLCSRRLLVQ